MNRQEKTKKNHRNMAPYLCKAWDIRVIQARYSEDGNWYGALEKFPAALLDANGYVIFDTEEEYRSCPQLKITKQINVPQGISAIPAFIKMHISEEQFQDAVRAALSDEPETRRKRLENAPTIPNKITVKSVVFERITRNVAPIIAAWRFNCRRVLG